jgi:hypothetical protein
VRSGPETRPEAVASLVASAPGGIATLRRWSRRVRP